ncbi:MAG TPA: hypothetical protein VIC53_04945, partial [Wenzhouxiangella sp.]
MVRGLVIGPWGMVLGCALWISSVAHAIGPSHTAGPIEAPSYVSAPIQATFQGQTLTYIAHHRPLTIEGPHGLAGAVIYATEYLVQTPDTHPRPVIFIWNGGPSVASTTLHMAGFGPKRLVIPEDVSQPIEPPFVLEDNPDTLLDRFDLVFIDPPEAGLSRALSPESKKWLYSAEGDARIMATFITQWLATHQRQDAPYYLMGTSYGSIRAAIMTRQMAEQPNPPA